MGDGLCVRIWVVQSLADQDAGMIVGCRAKDKAGGGMVQGRGGWGVGRWGGVGGAGHMRAACDGEAGVAKQGIKQRDIQQAKNCFLTMFERHLLKAGVEDKSAASTCHIRLSSHVKTSRSSSHSRLNQHQTLQHMAPAHPSPHFPVIAAARDVSQQI